MRAWVYTTERSARARSRRRREGESRYQLHSIYSIQPPHTQTHTPAARRLEIPTLSRSLSSHFRPINNGSHVPGTPITMQHDIFCMQACAPALRLGQHTHTHTRGDRVCAAVVRLLWGSIDFFFFILHARVKNFINRQRGNYPLSASSPLWLRIIFFFFLAVAF